MKSVNFFKHQVRGVFFPFKFGMKSFPQISREFHIIFRIKFGYKLGCSIRLQVPLKKLILLHILKI